MIRQILLSLAAVRSRSAFLTKGHHSLFLPAMGLLVGIVQGRMAAVHFESTVPVIILAGSESAWGLATLPTSDAAAR